MRRRFLNNIKSISSGYHLEYFTIEALEDGLTASLSINACEYSLDGNTWNNLSAETATPIINTGEKIYFRGNLTPTSSNGIGKFTISKKCNVKGNIMSLLYGDDFIGQNDLSSKSYAFKLLFEKCARIKSTKNLILPATILAERCYYQMFLGCTGLTEAPELPATTLAERCYDYMFNTCTNLTTAPELPATTLANYCYYGMFLGCTSLTTVPELPATTLANYCYQYMFRNCTSLTEAPELPATTLANYCYYGMFYGCTSLIEAPELPATTLANYCYQYMFRDCTSLIEAPELPATTLANYCYQYMFRDCTSLTEAPELPGITLANYCYQYMFKGCTGLTEAPELPATTLAKYCYRYMFQNCSKLNKIIMLAVDISASSCLTSWVSGVSSTGTFIKNANMTSLSTGVNGIPSGWTVEDYQGSGNDTSNNLITFTIEGTEYQAEEGMTWGEWVNSDYNTRPFYIHTGKNNIYLSPIVDNGMTYAAVLLNSTAVTLTDVIIENNIYSTGIPTGRPRSL